MYISIYVISYNFKNKMLLFFSLFFILFSFWIVLFIFNSSFTITLLLIGIVISSLIALLSIKSRLYSANSEFTFLQFGFYSMFIKKIIVFFSENVYLAFQFLKPNSNVDPVIDYLFIENDNIFENNLANNTLNMNFGIISAIIKNQCLIIHSINYLFFSPNQLYFLSLETQKVSDDSII